MVGRISKKLSLTTLSQFTHLGFESIFLQSFLPLYIFLQLFLPLYIFFRSITSLVYIVTMYMSGFTYIRQLSQLNIFPTNITFRFAIGREFFKLVTFIANTGNIWFGTRFFGLFGGKLVATPFPNLFPYILHVYRNYGKDHYMYTLSLPIQYLLHKHHIHIRRHRS